MKIFCESMTDDYQQQQEKKCCTLFCGDKCNTKTYNNKKPKRRKMGSKNIGQHNHHQHHSWGGRTTSERYHPKREEGREREAIAAIVCVLSLCGGSHYMVDRRFNQGRHKKIMVVCCGR